MEVLEAILCDAVERRMVDIEYTRFATNVDEIAEHDSNSVFDRTQSFGGLSMGLLCRIFNLWHSCVLGNLFLLLLRIAVLIPS